MCELQNIDDIYSIENNTKIASGVNLFNMMVKNAFIKFGIMMNFLQWKSLFCRIKYNIGGDILNLDKLEHGVLTANSIVPGYLSEKMPLAKLSGLWWLVVSKVDPCIHYAFELNWVSKIPPVRTFIARGIYEELRTTSVSYWYDDDNFMVDDKRRVFFLPAILDCYCIDFHKEKTSMFGSYFRGEKKESLKRILENNFLIQ